MAKHGASEIKIEIDDAPGGSLVDITEHVRTIGGIKIENILTPSHPFGTAWDEMLATGHARVPAFQMGGFWDTSADGPHDVLQITPTDRSPSGATRTFKMTFAAGIYVTGELRLQSYEVLGKNENLTEYASNVQPTGEWTWGTE